MRPAIDISVLAGFGQLDPVAFNAINGSDMHSIRSNNWRVLRYLVSRDHR